MCGWGKPCDGQVCRTIGGAEELVIANSQQAIVMITTAKADNINCLLIEKRREYAYYVAREPKVCKYGKNYPSYASSLLSTGISVSSRPSIPSLILTNLL